MNRIFFTAILIMLVLNTGAQVIAFSDSRITTHTLTSGDVVLGISSAGGGYINMIDLPGKGDIMDIATDRYGRGGQSAMRDQLRSGKYNPTQAGFNEPLGTPSDIIITGDSMVISARNCALWHGDGKYDYIRWENIGADPYNSDGGNSDVDGINEENLEGKQLTEVGSEFDFYGIYENYMGRNGIDIPCFRHYYEYRFIRTPGHCMSQFGPGTSVYNPNNLHADISTRYPDGTHAATDSDMSYLVKVWSLRNDISKWDPPYRHLIGREGEWILQDRTDDLAGGSVLGAGAAYQPLVIIGESADTNAGLSLGLYRPETDINLYTTAGVNESTGAIEYKDDRALVVRMLEQPRRIPSMGKYGFYLQTRGLLNRQRTDPGVYEMVRSEFYMLVGTPYEIREAAKKIHDFRYSTKPPSEWHFNTDVEGWTLLKSLTGNVSNGILSMNITGGDPYMTSPDNLGVDASQNRYVIIRMRNGTGTNSGRLYWTTDTQANFNISHSTEVSINPNESSFSTYVLDMSYESNWNGTIKQIRLDPSNAATSGTVDIDFIMITNDIAADIVNAKDNGDSRIYPVPAQDYFVVEAPLPSGVSVYNSLGKLMDRIPEQLTTHTIQSTGWPSGLYFVRVENDRDSETLKLLIK